LLDNVFHKSYKARRDRYVQLMADYDRHTTELGSFLKRVFVYSKAGQVTDETRNEISSWLHSLDYYKNYYVGRNEPKAVSCPYLDGVIYSFEQILSSGFTNGKEQLQTLSENLRGDELYYSTLENDTQEIKQGYVTYYVNGVSFNMVRVKGGTFTMGATAEQGGDAYDDEKPAHQVTLSSFMMGQTEVTQELWEAVMGNNPSSFKGAKRPVERVSWDDCQEFIKKLNALTGQNFRLPTEAEWEYAARGGSKSQGYKYSGSNNVDDVAWYAGNSGDKTHEVATKQPNELGLYDMSGNVREWCQDWYGENYYSSSPSSNPQGPSSGSYRVRRGGSWINNARFCRVARRYRGDADFRYGNLGFRLAL
jgi:formylglycine-generating enzyme required for sulfatase activity